MSEEQDYSPNQKVEMPLSLLRECLRRGVFVDALVQALNQASSQDNFRHNNNHYILITIKNDLQEQN